MTHFDVMHYIGWLLGFENTRSIDAIDLTFAAPWAGEQRWAVAGVCLLAIGGTVAFYRHFENCQSKPLRITLTTIRAALLCLLIVTLGAPLMHSSATVVRLPLVYLIVDDSESMGLADSPSEVTPDATASRTVQLRRLLSDQGGALISRLEEETECRVEAFKISSDKTTSLAKIDRQAIETELIGNGKTTPLLDALAAIPKQGRAEQVAAVIVFSDFNDTSGDATRDDLMAALSSNGIPIQTVGLGATQLTDVAIDLRTEAKAKLGEPTTVTIELRHSGLDQEVATVKLEARALEYEAADKGQAVQQVAQWTLTLDAATTTLELSFTPETSGVVELVAKVAPFSGELLLDNNVATQQIGVIEDYLRIMYVDYEPNWEWRFMKEVFGRDELVGRDGFRTYLASAAANVRAENALFNNELNLRRSEFLANDVLFVGDGPRELFTPEFCQLTEEFVGRLGGGLVVVSGPRFGPQQLAETPLANMLPVRLSADARLRDQAEFTLQRTSEALLYPFMRLADSTAEDAAAWNNLGQLPWYQPVAGVHEHAQVLAEHPADLCDDGKTRQPLIAIRPYGKGQVVYVGFNEMWRLRKRYGDRYYQRFWSQLIYRLGMSHAVGAEKRFVAEFDRFTYRLGEDAVFTVEAFDDEYQPLGLSQLTEGSLVGELTVPGAEGETTRKISIPMTRPGHLEAVIPLAAEGRYAVRITDPINGRTHERSCLVSDVSIERRQIVRNSDLQRRIAGATGGSAYDMSEVNQMIRELVLEPAIEQEHRQTALWNTPMWFLLVVGLMLSEWTIRKLMFLR
ncbi:MAG: hypothetical protein O3C40_00845 [Planctomycetota bacterium]|nr:hypothetical protein [Planctomycetota bacterium]